MTSGAFLGKIFLRVRKNHLTNHPAIAFFRYLLHLDRRGNLLVSLSQDKTVAWQLCQSLNSKLSLMLAHPCSFPLHQSPSYAHSEDIAPLVTSGFFARLDLRHSAEKHRKSILRCHCRGIRRQIHFWPVWNCKVRYISSKVGLRKPRSVTPKNLYGIWWLFNLEVLDVIFRTALAVSTALWAFWRA